MAFQGSTESVDENFLHFGCLGSNSQHGLVKVVKTASAPVGYDEIKSVAIDD